MSLSHIFENTHDKLYGLARLAKWHEKVRQSGCNAFNTVARSIQNHYETILTTAAPTLQPSHSTVRRTVPKSKRLEVNSEG